jgi:hypothetical protein
LFFSSALVSLVAKFATSLVNRWAKRIHLIFILFLILFLGCGEQNMVGLVPNIYLLQYLKSNAKVRKCAKKMFLNIFFFGFQVFESLAS